MKASSALAIFSLSIFFATPPAFPGPETSTVSLPVATYDDLLRAIRQTRGSPAITSRRKSKNLKKGI